MKIKEIFDKSKTVGFYDLLKNECENAIKNYIVWGKEKEYFSLYNIDKTFLTMKRYQIRQSNIMKIY